MAPADPEQPNWRPSIVRFLGFVHDRNCAHEIVEPGDTDDDHPRKTRPFMPLNQIQGYFGARNYTELRDVLAALFPDDPILPKDIFSKYIAVFCTLLCIGKGHYIEHFKHYESLSDTSLPFNPASPPANWPNTAGDSDFLRKFSQAQWKFCARKWEDLSDKHYDSEQILPIIFKKRLSGGGSANIWLVKIHPFYNRLISENAKLLLGDDADTFVLKEYSTADARVYYENETAAFNKVGSGPSADHNIIKHYGSFIRGDTFNLLLEYADKGTLRKVFAEDSAPTGEEDIIRFWEQIFKLTHSLHCIHTVKSSAPGGPQIFQGWHQDVKPENILVVSNGKKHPHEWDYKLADLGLSHFKNKCSSREDSTSSDTYGTKTYGAPECSRPDLFTEKSKLKVKQNIDIWSLGCVYSEIIRWLAQGQLGVLEYQRERKAEIRELDQAVGATDCFHNGESVLDAVRKSHEISVARLRKTDLITDYVVHMVGEMLVDADDRRDAQKLSRQQSRILEKAWKKLDEKTNSLSPGHTVNSNERTQAPRSQTHPTSSVSPKIPPSLPPEFTGMLHSPIPNHLQDNAASLSSDLGNGPSTLSFFPDDDRRLSLEPVAEHNSESGPVQHESPSSTSRLSSSLTPPSAQSPLFIPNSSQFHSQEVLENTERSSWNEGRSLPTRGSPQMSELPSPGYSAASPRLTSMTGSLGHNSRHSPRASLVNGNVDYRRSAPGFDPQTNPLIGDFTAQQNTANISQHYRNESYQSATSTIPSSSPPIGVQYQYPGPSSFAPQPQRPEPKSRKSRSRDEISVSKEMSITEALDWKLECKTTKTEAPGINKELRKELDGRDHIFLIDDSNSMAELWDEVAVVFAALSYIVKGTDKDGLDLYFRNSANFAKSIKKTSELITLVKAQKKTSKDAELDFDFRLNQILESRTEKLGGRGSLFSRKPKPMSLYILTDGVWDFDGYAQEPIKNAVQKLSGVSKSRKQIGIQFIRFGDNLEGVRRLEHLDNGLGLPSDIVDTEPADGNVWKMLLGPINAAFDGDQRQNPTVTSPGDMAGPSSFKGTGYGR